MNLSVRAQVNGMTVLLDTPSDFQLVLEQSYRNGVRFLQAKLTNLGSVSVPFGGFTFDGFEFDAPGPHIQVYREGWTAVSAVASRRFGECDLYLDPDYKPFAVVDSAAYCSDVPNRFSAENVMVLHDDRDDHALLAGFVTGKNFFNRFQIELEEAGVQSMQAILYGDGIRFDPGETIVSEKLVVMEGNDGYELLEHFADIWGWEMNARSFSHIPTGWCSWYYYFKNITEKDVCENLEFLATHRDEYPIEYFQIDDGYQVAPGDWFSPSEQFPHGILPVLEKITKAGLKPGLWLAPFVVCSQTKLYQEHPEYLLHDQAGNILHPIPWRGDKAAILDCSRADACQFLTELFTKLRENGCGYVKLDFMMYESCVSGACYSDPKCTRAMAFRRGFEAIRKGIGEEAFILGGTVILSPIIGLVNGSRYSSDIVPCWRYEEQKGKEAPAVPNDCRNIILRRYMHRRLFLNDPDVHIARKDSNDMTEAEIQLWTTALFLAGGLLLLSDRFTTLDPERAKLSKWLLSEVDAFDTMRPADWFEREMPAVWYGKRKKNGQYAIGLLNLYDEPLTLTVDLKKLRLNPAQHFEEFWSKTPVVVQDGKITVTLEPHGARLFL